MLGESAKKVDGWTVTPWTASWFSRSSFEQRYSETFRGSIFTRRYGGDLQGIIDHLEYIQDLGVRGIYLTPVFEAASLHKYDASMYHHVDVNFGPDPAGDVAMMKKERPWDTASWIHTSADRLFLKLVQLVHEHGMRIIIDGVFNHTGTGFWAFQDLMKNGAKSRFVDWYKIRKFYKRPVRGARFAYDCWWGLPSLPMLNRDGHDMHPAPKQHIFDITSRWMDPDHDGDPGDGIDGWRLDVPKDLPIGFWKDWARHAKQINPDAFLTGELWENSPDHVSREGPFDSLMNYEFARAVNDFFVARKNPIPPSAFVERLRGIDASYPRATLHCLQNLMNSHDTERLTSLVANPDRQYNSERDERNPHYNPGKPDASHVKLVKLIVAFQVAYRGAPMFLYGDEVGMWGAHDPHCRKPMLWPGMVYDDEIIDDASGFRSGFGRYRVEPDMSLLSFYKALLRLRNDCDAIKTGTLDFFTIDDGTRAICFARRVAGQEFIACFNASSQDHVVQVPVTGARYLDPMTGERVGSDGGELRIVLPGTSFKYVMQEGMARPGVQGKKTSGK